MQKDKASAASCSATPVPARESRVSAKAFSPRGGSIEVTALVWRDLKEEGGPERKPRTQT